MVFFVTLYQQSAKGCGISPEFLPIGFGSPFNSDLFRPMQLWVRGKDNKVQCLPLEL
jgi:hypothetical protein